MDTDDSLSTAVVVGDGGGAVLKKVSSTLEKAGFVVMTASSKAALDRCGEQHRPVDLAVIDTGGAGMKAMEVAERLQKMCPRVRMLFLSDGTEAPSEGTLPGYSRQFLLKPFRRSRFLGLVLEMMERPKAMSA